MVSYDFKTRTTGSTATAMEQTSAWLSIMADEFKRLPKNAFGMLVKGGSNHVKIRTVLAKRCGFLEQADGP